MSTLQEKINKIICWLIGHDSYHPKGIWDWEKCVRCGKWICVRHWTLEDVEFSRRKND